MTEAEAYEVVRRYEALIEALVGEHDAHCCRLPLKLAGDGSWEIWETDVIDHPTPFSAKGRFIES